MNHLTAAWRSILGADAPLPAALQAAIDAFDGTPYLDPAKAQGKCYEAAVAFAKAIPGARLANWARPIDPDRVDDSWDPEWDEEEPMAHVACIVPGDIIVDWSIRQFWPDAPVPVVEPLHVYRRRFKTFDGFTRP